MKNDNILIGAAYIRVSTGKQEELSPDSQIRLIREYAKANNIVIPEEYIFMEGGISGRKADKRPQFQKMIGLAKGKKFNVILLWKFSRFARNQEESIVYKSMLRKIGIDIVSISEPLVEGPFGSLIERIIEWMDEFYSIRLAGDVTRGMTEKAMRGGYQCRPPLGYMIPYHNAPPQIVPEEAAIIRLIFNEYVNNNLSIYQITRKLNMHGYKTSHNKAFEKRSIEYILDNPSYAGMVRWNRTENETNRIKDESEWIIRDGQHEAIISTELFNAAKDRRNRETIHRNIRPSETYKHWLSGILKCSSCGRTLTSSSKKKNNNIHYSFQCYGYSKGKCITSHSISLNKIQPIVLDAIKEVIDSGNIQYEMKDKKSTSGDNDIEILKKQLDRLDVKEKRIKDAYINEIDTMEEYRNNKAKLETDRKKILDELNSIHLTPTYETDQIMLRRLNTVYDILTSGDTTVSEKSLALKNVVEKIVFDRPHMHIDVYYYYIPDIMQK